MNEVKLMCDSGAHSLFQREVGHATNKNNINWSFYESDAFWKYVDEYAMFLHKNKHKLDVYVNVDVIFNPELTWKAQRYLEDVHKLKPLPVVHSGVDLSWFKKYMDNYDYIGMSGMGGSVSKGEWMRTFGTPAFSLLCKPPDFIPTHKIHGFAVTSASLLARYPFYSVDSTSWIQFGKYGAIIIPKRVMDRYDYKTSPFITFVSSRPERKKNKTHFENFTSIHQDYFDEYLKEKGFIMGKSEFKTVTKTGYTLQEDEQWSDRTEGLVEVIVEPGLCNQHELRDQLNTEFYLDLEASIPPWPWTWRPPSRANTLFGEDE